jgi:hypothetical protein
MNSTDPQMPDPLSWHPFNPAGRVEETPAYKRWQLAKQTMWLALLTVSFLIFHLIDIMQETILIEMMRF